MQCSPTEGWQWPSEKVRVLILEVDLKELEKRLSRQFDDTKGRHFGLQGFRVESLLGRSVIVMWVNVSSNTKTMKKRSERRKHCTPAVVPHRCIESAMAVVRQSQNFPPPQTPFPGAQDRQNLISWRWSQSQFGEDQCTRFRVIVVTYTAHHKHTDRTNYNTLRR